MFKRWHICLVVAILALLATSASAQVDKVEMATDGISCGNCAVIDEIYRNLKHLDGVDKVSIRELREHVVVSYKAGASFHPEALRDVLRKGGVVVDEFRISAHGQVQQEGGKKFFLAGKIKFLLVPSPDLPPNGPSDGPASLEAILNDQTNPMELDVISFTPLKELKEKSASTASDQ